MAEGASPNTANHRNLSLCNECGSNPWKYRCPGCSIRSCSLACVNSHKKRTGCMGKRSHTEVVPLSQFDDNLLLSDYKLLEETKRVTDSARRKGSDFRGYFRLRLPNKLWNLRKAANRRKTCLLFFPPGMSKREKNNSRYNPRKNNIFWTIELRFYGTDVALLHHNVDEHGSLLSIFRKHLAPGPWNHKLRPFCDVQLEDLKLFVRKNPKGSKSLFRKLDIKAPIHRQFANITILEYPVIFVYLPSFDHDFEVETRKIPSIRDTVPPSICPRGTLYKVEEVEEGDGASDTIITDLMDCRKSEDSNVPSNTCLTNELATTDNAIHFTDKQIPKTSNGGFRHQLCEKNHAAPTPNLHESVDAGFYFDQEVRDAYSDLIGEMNPDDFLCLDGACDDDDELGEAIWYDMDESKRDDEDILWNSPLDPPGGYSFEISKGNVLGESKGNEGFKELEEAEGNVLKKMRIGDAGEIGDRFFFSDEVPFGEMELEEGEIPCFL
ncbi:hypothetical protein KSP39_PZI021923 [Platanthera zijinensis]|uniref:Box C/D snoRNA protein 1 n=1 Tax=Platanthera zijinensis TaxID=2320716 RepID=A0AAP0AYN0_9ASPA